MLSITVVKNYGLSPNYFNLFASMVKPYLSRKVAMMRHNYCSRPKNPARVSYAPPTEARADIRPTVHMELNLTAEKIKYMKKALFGRKITLGTICGTYTFKGNFADAAALLT